MIRTFRDKDAKALFSAGSPRRLRAIHRQAERKLQMLDSAKTVSDLNTPPGNRLEAIKGDREGARSVRINEQWRLCFRFEDGDAFDVEIVDYH